MKTLTKELGAVLGAAFGDEGFDPHYGAVRLSDRPELAQFQCNGAMQAAKKAGENPRGLAERIVERIKGNNIFSQTEIAGPGFINLSITDTALAGYLAQGAADERLGAPQFADGETMILDYGGPNAAKAMHVGHLRPTVIGDCLKRIMRHAGYKALGDVHMGDWGLQFGQIISEMERLHPDWAYFQNAESGPFPEEPPFTFPELEEIYPAAAAACKENPARLEEARRTTAELQRGKPGYMAVWRDVMKLSMDHMKANFDALDVHFEIWKGEADVEGLIPEVEQDLRQKGLAEESEGAVIVPVAEESDRKTIPPLIYKKSDGAATYGTTDVATIYDRVQNYPDLKALVYVVDKRQELHFEQVFRAARKAGYADGISLDFIGFGTLNGPDGKPFKSRAGGVMRLDELLALVRDQAETRMVEAELAQDIPEEERRKIAHNVAVAAIKFADLSNQPHVDYIFDIDRMTRFEGKTGPYLLYQAVRIKSMLKKAEERGFTAKSSPQVDAVSRDLALALSQFPESFAVAARDETPHILCDYVYKLAQSFASFYGACHILSEPDAQLREARLALVRLTLTYLEKSLDLLGISVPERM